MPKKTEAELRMGMQEALDKAKLEEGKLSEFGTYVEGQGYVAGKRKPVVPAASTDVAPVSTPPSTGEIIGKPIQDVLYRLFGTVPRNRLKESGLE